ncbi:MAG TPA: hypothetical protein VGK73_03930 [Polyangiaceae bacterium]
MDDANHARLLMGHLIKHRAAIAALEPVLSEAPETIEFRAFYGHIDPTWFRLHLDHDLCVRDEYGKIDGTCGERFTCAECDRVHYCRLGQGHDGRHRVKS